MNDAFFARLSTLMRENRFSEAVELLRSKIAAESDPWAQLEHMGNLAMVLNISGRQLEAVAVMRDAAALMPDDSLSWTGLARYLLYRVDSTENDSEREALKQEVLQTIEHAVAVAERAGGIGLRNSLSDRARFARTLERWDLVEESIRRILAIPDVRDVPDAPVEVDFLRDLPAGAVDAELVERLRRKHADGPQKDVDRQG
jgi:hypothetical protein